MATSARKLIAPQPPADLATVSLAFIPAPDREWYRITDRKHRSPLYWSRSGVYRFDSPTAKHGVCYAASTCTAAFQEIWGDRVRSRAPISWDEFALRDVWKITMPAGYTVTPLHGANLTSIRATMQCFSGSYPTSQTWGAALMQHPSDLDALEYIGRRSGSRCLALFGDKSPPKAYQAGLHVERMGPLVAWNRFFALRSQLRIRIANLPATRPVMSFDAP